MMRRLYDWMMRMAGHERAPHVLAIVSFIESSIFPIPPDVMLIPMALKNRAKAWYYAALCTLASVIGGVAGYAIGYYLLEYVGMPIIRLYGVEAKWQQLAELFKEWGVWVLLIKGPTPFPFKILTIFAGAAHMNLAAFIGASILSRALRFFLVAGLIYYYGDPIREFIERRLNLLATLFAIVLIGSFVAIKFLF